jgi:hypothetical protein
LQRSVTLMRSTRTAEIDLGPVSNAADGLGVGISRMGKRTGSILASGAKSLQEWVRILTLNDLTGLAS